MGRLPAHLPPLSLPVFSFDTLRELAPKALAVALLGLIEALSIARSLSTYSRQQIDGNQEFIGQGLSNIIGSFFSSYAGSGSFTRSGINYHAGAMTPLSAVFAAVFLALILLLIAPLTSYLPVPAMAGVILLVAYNLIDYHHIRSIVRTSKEETAVLLTAFLATLLLDLEFAIYAGVLLSLILYLSRTSHPRIVNLAPDPNSDRVLLTRSELECPNFKIIRIDGSLFFGAVSHVAEFLYGVDKNSVHKSHVLIVASGINSIDVAGAEMLVHEAQRRRKLRGELYLCGLKQQAREVLQRGGYIDILREDHIFDSETEAILGILPRLDHADCDRCVHPLFKDCKNVCSI
jgi:SulP family sulfate permease